MRQIYSDNNVRVRGLQARVDEIQKQMQQLGGTADAPSGKRNQKDDQSIFPSIRSLPGLGVNYADLYRTTKVEEAVFETLTQEYELAKVQEAKETPSVKLIDSPDVPEKYSFPRRSWVIWGASTLFLLSGAVWIFGTEHWEKIEATDPGKAFVIEIASALKPFLPATLANRNSPVHSTQSESEQIKSEH
jgi:capsule polysaccharide export protein KpsE/RkpR